MLLRRASLRKTPLALPAVGYVARRPRFAERNSKLLMRQKAAKGVLFQGVLEFFEDDLALDSSPVAIPLFFFDSFCWPSHHHSSSSSEFPFDSVVILWVKT
jgi:hypothetical protein